MAKLTDDLSIRPVEDILNRVTDDASGETVGTEILIFELLGDQELPDALRKSFKLFMWAGGYGVSIVLLAVFWKSLQNPFLKAAAVSAVLALGLLVLLSAIQRQRKVNDFANLIRSVLAEMVKIRDGLRRYQADLDRRTSKYYHCVTHNKIRSYFVIIQLIAALTRRIELIEGFLQSGTLKSVRAAHELLNRHLTFTDGATSESGHMRKIQLINLSKVARELTDNLDKSIELLEQQLGIGPDGKPTYFDRHNRLDP